MHDTKKKSAPEARHDAELRALETVTGGSSGFGRILEIGFGRVGSAISNIYNDGGIGMFAPMWKYSEMMDREMARDYRDQMEYANTIAPEAPNMSGADVSFNAGSGGFFGEE